MNILIVYDNRGRAMDALAGAIAEGARGVTGAEVWLRTIDNATYDELAATDALVLGCPNWSGVTTKLKEWLDAGEDFWEKQLLVGKVGAAFVTGRSRGSGNEVTLLQLWHVLVANGMVMVGLPWDDAMRESSHSYYGLVGVGPATEADLRLARSLGRRVAEVTRRLNTTELGRP